MKAVARLGKGRHPGALLFAAISVLALVALLAWLLSPRGDDTVRVERFVTRIEMVTPPPPPEPEPEDPIMEEKEEIVEPSEMPTEEPIDQPQDTSDATTPSQQLAGLDRPADAGSDNFKLAAGGGGGLFGRGTGGGGDEWGRYVEGHIRRALQRDPRTRTARGSLRVQVTIADDGRFIGAALRSSTGDSQLDAAVRRVLENLPRLSVGRPQGRPAETFATIDMKRS